MVFEDEARERLRYVIRISQGLLAALRDCVTDQRIQHSQVGMFPVHAMPGASAIEQTLREAFGVDGHGGHVTLLNFDWPPEIRFPMKRFQTSLAALLGDSGDVRYAMGRAVRDLANDQNVLDEFDGAIEAVDAALRGR